MGAKSVFDRIYKLFETYYLILAALIVTVALFNLFYNLGNTAIDNWDEARHGVNAYEMLKNNNFIVSTYSYQPDYWNLKPPLSFWTIILGYKLMGYNALGLRIFSALAALGTIVEIFYFVKYRHGRVAALISAATLTTTTQYILSHCARTGDADALFVLLFTTAMLSLMLIERSRVWLYVTGLSFSLAFLTKSWHAGNLGVIVGLYLLISGEVFKIRFKEWLTFLASSLIPILAWSVFRYSQDGLVFFQTMVQYDLLNRSSNVIEGHVGGFSYYFHFLNVNYFYWLIILIASFIGYQVQTTDFFSKDRRNYVLAIALWIIVPFGLYTFASTKIYWYILPVYPVLAICIGAFCNQLLKIPNLALQGVLTFGILASLFLNERYIQTQVLLVQTDPPQAVLQQLKGMKNYSGAIIYTMDGAEDDPRHWKQSHLLSAELYNDLIALDGGLEEFLKDSHKNTLLLYPKNLDYNFIRDTFGLKILTETDKEVIMTQYISL